MLLVDRFLSVKAYHTDDDGTAAEYLADKSADGEIEDIISKPGGHAYEPKLADGGGVL